MAKIKATKIHDSFGDKVLNLIIGALLIVCILVVAYPVIFIISSSVSSSTAVSNGKVVLLPVDFSLEAYEFVFQYKQIWTGFKNSVFYTTVCVFTATTCTILMAYPLSRPEFQGKKFYTMFFWCTRYVAGGLLPSYILRCELGMYDTIWPLITWGWVSMSDVLILRTAFRSSIPRDLFDAATIDGASHLQSMTQIAVPLSKATISVLILYSINAMWNEYFTSMLYLRNPDLFPLQLVLRPIMTAATAAEGFKTASQITSEQGLENVRYAMIIIGSAPVLAAYMCIQKFFKGGVMLGSLKG